MNIETANRLLQYRKKHCLSQEELAEKIGVSRQAVSKWERAEASPDTDNLILLAQIYGVTLDELLTGKNDDEAHSADDSEKENTEQESTESDDYNTYNDNGNADEHNSRRKDHVYFDKGIHVDAKNGDRVHVGWSGVHVNAADGTNVSVDKNGVFVEENGQWRKADKDGHIFHDHDHHKKSNWYKFPYPIAAVVVFLAWGFTGVLGGFAYAWLFFLTIPLYYTLVGAILRREPRIFCYPVLMVILFFVWGFWGGAIGGFAVSWIVFLTIPIYYFICNVIEHRNKN